MEFLLITIGLIEKAAPDTHLPPQFSRNYFHKPTDNSAFDKKKHLHYSQLLMRMVSNVDICDVLIVAAI